ncbi:MAG: hypothetical protein K6E63_11975 [Lachnospiraceae bacterium]|nr:hypothetical protein [Lachnospiraceae bacterium]
MKKTVISLLTALIVITAAVAFKNVYSCEIPIGNRGIRAAIKEGDLDLLFIGSSTFRSNLNIHTLDEAVNDRAFIISYGGNQYAATSIQYDEIKKRSKAGYGLMVFELDPLMLTEEVKLSDSRVIWDLSFDGKRALWGKLKNEGNAGLPVMYEYFVTSGMDDLITYPVTERFYSTRYYKGAKTDDTKSSGKEFLENEQFDISDSVLIDAQADAVREVIEKCKRDSQPFIFLESPHYYRLEDDPVYVEYHKYFVDLMNEYDVECVYAHDIDFDNHEPDFYEDMSHMSSKGRTVYTEKLVDLLRSRGLL